MSFIDVTKYLTDYVQYAKTTRSIHAQTVVSTITTLSCFAFQGGSSRVREGQRNTECVGWSIVFGTNARSLLNVGDMVIAVTTKDGVTKINSGTVKTVNPYSHWEHGMQLYVTEID